MGTKIVGVVNTALPQMQCAVIPTEEKGPDARPLFARRTGPNSLLWLTRGLAPAREYSSALVLILFSKWLLLPLHSLPIVQMIGPTCQGSHDFVSYPTELLKNSLAEQSVGV